MNRLSALFVAAVASASAATAQTADFNAIITEVLARNPQLAADSLTARADLLALAAEGNLPDPEVGFDHLWGSREGDPRWGLEVTQGFDWPGAYRARRRATSAARAAVEASARDRMRRAALEARLLLIDVVDANLNVKARRRIKENFDSLLSLTRRRFDSGDVTILTLKKMEFECYGAGADLEEAESNLDRLRADLAAMAGGKLIDTDGLTDFPQERLLAEADYMKRPSPALEALSLTADSRRLAAKAESLSRLPGFSVGYVHEYEEGEHFNGFSLGMTLPVFSTRHRRAEALARSEAAEAETTIARLNRNAAIRAAYAEAERLDRRVDTYHRVFGNDDYLHLLLKAYEQGQLTAHEYLGEINEYLSLYLDHLASETAYHRALARLQSL